MVGLLDGRSIGPSICWSICPSARGARLTLLHCFIIIAIVFVVLFCHVVVLVVVLVVAVGNIEY